jgi:multidrug efflux system outer membrane protein
LILQIEFQILRIDLWILKVIDFEKFIINTLCIMLLALMTSCSIGPSYQPPSIEVPPSWKNHQSENCEGYAQDENGEIIYDEHWWQVFDDEKLNELESWAVANNRDLFVAFERVEEARALMGIAASQFYPQITLNPLATNTVSLIKNFNQNNTKNTGAAGIDTYSSHGGGANQASSGNNIIRAHQVLYSLPLDLSYEVDLWGKIRDQYDSETFNWLAKQKDYEAIMLTLTSNLAMAYYQLRTADAQLNLLLEVLKTRQKAYEINKDRYEEEITFYADVTLAAEEIDIAIVQYYEVKRQRDVLEDLIAVLIGVPPSEFYLNHMPLEGLPPCIPEGIPSEVLLRRPDIAEAEYLARSEHALVKQAYTQFFPSLTLTASTGFQSPLFKEFMTWMSRYWMHGVQINQLVFDGGKASSILKLQIARFLQASGNYQQQVLVAFQEVENALASLDSYAEQYKIGLGTVQWAQKSYQLYLDRYFLGVSYYINVANTERDLLNFQIDVNALQGLRYLATIQLIKALGGGW